jgi:hypothetical protein
MKFISKLSAVALSLSFVAASGAEEGKQSPKSILTFKQGELAAQCYAVFMKTKIDMKNTNKRNPQMYPEDGSKLFPIILSLGAYSLSRITSEEFSKIVNDTTLGLGQIDIDLKRAAMANNEQDIQKTMADSSQILMTCNSFYLRNVYVQTAPK